MTRHLEHAFQMSKDWEMFYYFAYNDFPLCDVQVSMSEWDFKFGACSAEATTGDHLWFVCPLPPFPYLLIQYTF